MLNQFGAISGVVRHILPAFAPQMYGLENPHSHIENVIGLISPPVSFAHSYDAVLSASLIRLY